MTPSPQPESPEPRWKCGNEFAPYHHQASHINPDHRDGWNACYRMAEAAIQAARNEAEAMRADAERYLAFFSAGLPITFLGQSYETKEELDAAIDAMKGDAHA